MIKLDNVVFNYQSMPMVFDLQIQAQEKIAIIGESGAGKSTLLNLIAGFEYADSGETWLNGENHTKTAPFERPVSMLFQENNLFTHLSVEENIALGLKPNLALNAEEKALVEQAARAVNLQDFLTRKPTALSGGQKQRVALARMMASQPEILLLDEPLSALDSFLKWQVEEELQDLLSEIGKTVLFVSHSRDEVYHLCDRICVLEKGHMETIQEKKEFFANPVTQAAARISGCRNIVPAKRLSAHQLEVPDWGICFELEKEIPEDISFVGVRAHYIEVSADLEPAKNSSIMQMDRLLEQQFESELVLKYNQDTMSLRILMDKEQAEQLAAHEKLRVTIPEHALLLLKA